MKSSYNLPQTPSPPPHNGFVEHESAAFPNYHLSKLTAESFSCDLLGHLSKIKVRDAD